MNFKYNEALFEQLKFLKKGFNLKGIKAEFEAEGSSYEDLVRLRTITAALDIKLYLKIGGVEAIRDIKDGMVIGVDGFIAPMVESVFGAGKFISTLDNLGITDETEVTINIETVQGLAATEDIIKEYGDKINNITIGRSDLSGSYLDPEVTPDSDVIFKNIEDVAGLLKDTDITLTVGGSLSNASLDKFSDNEKLTNSIYKLETRKVILPTNVMVFTDDAIEEALKFETLWLESQVNLTNILTKDVKDRIVKLTTRA